MDRVEYLLEISQPVASLDAEPALRELIEKRAEITADEDGGLSLVEIRELLDEHLGERDRRVLVLGLALVKSASTLSMRSGGCST